MKNIIGLVTLSMGVIMLSCASEPAKTDIVVVPAQAAQPEKTNTIVIEKESQPKSTTIVLDKNGIKVEAKKIDVTVKSE
ncbi:MAG: hypothetical protein V4667_01870 [Bacteroidota bacterium]